jgi:hypothetical protein
MAVRKLKYPFTLNQGTGVFITNTGVDFDGSAPLTYQIGVGNDIFTTGKVQFSAVTSSTSTILLGTTTFTDSLWDGNFSSNGLSVTGSLTITGNATVQGNVTAEEIISELTSSMALFKSGSTLFGDTIDDNHYITGSLYETGSFELNGYSVKEISSDVLLADSSSTALVTERAFKTYMDTIAGGIDSATNAYLRKNYNKTASSVSNNTASFSALSASAGTLTATSETDFLFFNNGQAMEHDALSIQQSGGTFYLIANSDSLGYNLASDDEIKAWGKFEPTGYLDFDGLTNEVTTNFSGSSVAPLNKTYSFWMKSSTTARNYSVFGYGSNKKGALTTNFSSGKVLMWNGNSWYTYWEDTSAQDDGEWHHWMVYNDVAAITGSKLYVDGILIDVDSFVTSGTVSNLNNQTQPLTIMSYQNNSDNAGRHFSGSMKEFSVFPGDKTSKASTYYNNGTPYDVTNEADLQGYWRMNEYSGSIAYDSSGEGNHGTINGATWNT